MIQNFYEKVEGSMFDFPTFYTWIANILIPNCRVVEVGVGNGSSFLYLAERLQGKAERIIAVENMAYGGVHQRNVIINNIIKSGANNVELMEMSSLDASTKFPGEYLNFVFLDSAHTYAQTRAEIILWYEKVALGYYLAGHDYFSEENPEVRMAVDELIPTDFIHFNKKLKRKEPVEGLRTEQTDKGYGIWWVKKDPRLKLMI